MTIIFERRQINDKVLILQFQFDSYEMNSVQTDGYSLDKYIGLDVWNQIYAKLDDSLVRYKDSVDKRPKDETIQMRRAQLELRVSWRTKQPFHREVVHQELKKCELCPFVMVIKIGMVSLLEKFKKHHSQEMLSTEKTQKIKTATTQESVDSNDTRTSNRPLENEIEEYVPAARTNVANSLKYTPSTVLKSTEKIANTDEYMPTVTNDIESEIVTYTPTKIYDSKIHSDNHKVTVKTDLNRNDYPSKKKRNDASKNSDLFGDSDDSIENNGRKNLRSTKRLINTEPSSRIGTPKPQAKLDSWINKTRSKYSKSTENGNTKDALKKRKIEEIIPTELSSPDKHSKKQIAKDEESKKLKALREEWAVINEEIVSDTVINLKDMKINEIMDTLPQHERSLRKRIQSFEHTHDRQIDGTEDWDYLLILDGLVVPEQQTEMYKKLRATFFKKDPKDAITSNRENLLWRWLVPEWALLIFMEKFMLSKNEALESLRQQERAKINSTEFDLEL